jgi:hypothetical protein
MAKKITGMKKMKKIVFVFALVLATIMTATATLPAKDDFVEIKTTNSTYFGYILEIDQGLLHLNCTTWCNTLKPNCVDGYMYHYDHGADIWIGVGQIESMVG